MKKKVDDINRIIGDTKERNEGQSGEPVATQAKAPILTLGPMKNLGLIASVKIYILRAHERQREEIQGKLQPGRGRRRLQLGQNKYIYTLNYCS